ncbi:hypothetical protein FRB93_008352 [Tulasnella sp. JGI-2019a]|nr:hypothetical protein FRB93_008352 [Tulasnella sp. JGI-2019a]
MPKAPDTEIDAIFAAKGRTKKSSLSVLPLVEQPASATKKKRNQKEAFPEEPLSQAIKRPTPEVLLDPSLKIEAQLAKATANAVPEESTPRVAKRLKSTKSREFKGAGSYVQKKMVERAEKEKDDDRKFMDSRGSGPRRKTEEGFFIYKEDELGIRDEGGGV